MKKKPRKPEESKIVRQWGLLGRIPIVQERGQKKNKDDLWLTKSVHSNIC